MSALTKIEIDSLIDTARSMVEPGALDRRARVFDDLRAATGSNLPDTVDGVPVRTYIRDQLKLTYWTANQLEGLARKAVLDAPHPLYRQKLLSGYLSSLNNDGRTLPETIDGVPVWTWLDARLKGTVQ